jgi:deoxyribodipyrimidine photo-lyase
MGGRDDGQLRRRAAGGRRVTTAIWWVRRDLRLADNQALGSATAAATLVVPTYVLDPHFLDSPLSGDKRVAFLTAGLRALDTSLRDRGSYLVIRAGDPARELARLVAETDAQAVFAEADHTPYACERDARVAEVVPLQRTDGVTVHPPGDVVKADGSPYVVFTPFSRAWLALPLPSRHGTPAAPERIATPAGICGAAIPDRPLLPPSVPFVAGEAAARRCLEAFVGGGEPPIYDYERTRDRPDLSGTSSLSPYLRFGMVSAREAAGAALAARAASPTQGGRRSAHIWLNELIWREFFIHILDHFPHVEFASFRMDLRRIAWSEDADGLEAWKQGRTGYPFVDAAMRQMAATGWMHNRARMVAASFLVKDLLVDWREGERHFMRHLVDGDPASNNGGWQWVAGTGTDAAPFFRVFNPVTQGLTHDPRGDYVRRWVPELSRVPDAYIQVPWEMPADAQATAGCVIDRDYPGPIVDHAVARERVLSAYGAARR